MQRRKSRFARFERKDAGAAIEQRSASLLLCEVKLSDEKAGTFSGYGAVFGNRDSYDDVIEKGAFKESLREWEALGKLPPMLLNHGAIFGGSADDNVPIGVWTLMEENSKGLKVEGRLFALGTQRGTYIYEGMKAGALDGLSIGFRTREARMGTKPGEPSRTLLNIDLRELSVVTFPANPKARIPQGSVKSVFATLADLSIEELREFEAALRDGGFSQKDAATALSSLKKCCDAYRHRDGGDPSPRDAVPSLVTDQTPKAEPSEAEVLEHLNRLAIRAASTTVEVEEAEILAALRRFAA